LALSEPPSALFCTNDLLAVDVLDTLERLGRRVPEAVSVAGFDGIALGGLGRVSLTTVAQPRDELARLAVELLVDRIEGRNERARAITLEPSLLVRGSTGPPP
jgi:LacI family transcriptional regulator